MRRSLVIVPPLLACGCSAPAASGTAPLRPPTVSFLVGAAAGSAAQFRQATGVRPAVVEHYVRPGTPFSAAFAGDGIPLIQLMPYGAALTSVAAGGQDTWLRSYARLVRPAGEPGLGARP